MGNNIVQPTQVPVNTATGNLVLDPTNMQSIVHFAEFMASGKSTLPKHLQGSPADCMAVVIQAMQWKMNPYAVAQKTHLVGDTLGYEAQLVHAVVTASGAITDDDFDYEFYGDWSKVIGNFLTKKNQNNKPYQVPNWTADDEKGCGVIIKATLAKSGKEKVLDLLLSQATVRNSTLWASDPKQQLAYLAVKRWARLHVPGVMLGVYTRDEIEDIPAEPREKVIDDGVIKRPGDDQVIEQPETNESSEQVVIDNDSGQQFSADELIDLMDEAENAEQLQAIAEDAAKLPEGPDRERVRLSYSAKKKLLIKALEEKLEKQG